MRKFDRICWGIAIVFVLAIVGQQALATCTYSTAAGSATTVASCNATTELAPTLATEGKSLAGVTGLRVMAVASGNMTAAGKLAAYLYSADAGRWVRAPSRDLTISAAATNEAWPDISVAVSLGRIDYRPLGAGANNTLIYVTGSGDTSPMKR